MCARISGGCRYHFEHMKRAGCIPSIVGRYGVGIGVFAAAII